MTGSEPIILFLLSIITLVIIAVSVVLIIFLKKLMDLSKEAEKTLQIVNNKLPETIQELHALTVHADKSLQELDKTLYTISEPVEKFSHMAANAQSMVSGIMSAGRNFRSNVHSDPDDFGMNFASFMGNNIGKILIGALSGGVVAFIRKMRMKKAE